MTDTGAGTLHLPEDEFVAEFESCRLPAAQFHHADHIRLAWIYLRQMNEPEAAERMGRVSGDLRRTSARPRNFTSR
jgi:hypothetical protein